MDSEAIAGAGCSAGGVAGWQALTSGAPHAPKAPKNATHINNINTLTYADREVPKVFLLGGVVGGVVGGVSALLCAIGGGRRRGPIAACFARCPVFGILYL